MLDTSGNKTLNISAELKTESFMLWRYEERDGRQTKPPINPDTGLRGDVTDPSQWTDYENALRIHQSGRFGLHLSCQSVSQTYSELASDRTDHIQFGGS